MLCVVRVPGEPVLTTATACGTAVRSSLGSARLLQWSKTQAYASNVYYTPVSSKVALDRHRVSWSWLQIGGLSCKSSAQLQRSCSSAEAASSVLSILSESWIARVGRANSSTRHKEPKIMSIPLLNCEPTFGASCYFSAMACFHSHRPHSRPVDEKLLWKNESKVARSSKVRDGSQVLADQI